MKILMVVPLLVGACSLDRRGLLDEIPPGDVCGSYGKSLLRAFEAELGALPGLSDVEEMAMVIRGEPAPPGLGMVLVARKAFDVRKVEEDFLKAGFERGRLEGRDVFVRAGMTVCFVRRDRLAFGTGDALAETIRIADGRAPSAFGSLDANEREILRQLAPGDGQFFRLRRLGQRTSKDPKGIPLGIHSVFDALMPGDLDAFYSMRAGSGNTWDVDCRFFAESEGSVGLLEAAMQEKEKLPAGVSVRSMSRTGRSLRAKIVIATDLVKK